MKYLVGYTDMFMSPITGKLRSLSQIPSLGSQGYILIGDYQGNAIASPALIDVRLDVIELRSLLQKVSELKFIIQSESFVAPNAQALDQLTSGFLYNNEQGILSVEVPGGGTIALPYGQVFVGDSDDLAQATQLLNKQLLIGNASDRAEPRTTLFLENLPDVTKNNLLIANDSNRLVPKQRIDNLNLPPFLTADPTNNFGIYNLYTGGTINIDHPIDDPGPVAKTTLRIDQSNLPNLRKGRIWMGVVNFTPPVITIDAVPPYFHVIGSLNWDAKGFLFDSYAVPTEVGLDPGTIFMGDYSSPGQIVQAGLTWGNMFIGNNLGQIVETTLNDGFTFIGTSTGRITQTGLDAGHLFIGDATGKIVQTGLNSGWVFIGNDSGQVVQTGLGWGLIFIGDSEGKLTQQGLLAHELWTGHVDDSGRMVATIALEVINLPALAHNHFWGGDDTDRPVPTLLEIQTGTGLTGGPIFGNGTISIADTGVEAGPYPYATLTVNAQGQLTSASSNLATIEEIQGQIAALEADITAINATLAGIAGEIVVINATLLALEISVTGLIASVATIQGQIASLNDQVGALQDAVGILNAQMAAVQADILVIQTQIANLRLNNIPADDDVSFYGFKAIDMGDAENPTDGVNLRTLQDAVSGAIGNITLDGFVEGNSDETGEIHTTRGPDCLLTNIPAGGNVSMDNYKINNLVSDDLEQLEAVNSNFLWDLMHDNVGVVYA